MLPLRAGGRCRPRAGRGRRRPRTRREVADLSGIGGSLVGAGDWGWSVASGGRQVGARYPPGQAGGTAEPMGRTSGRGRRSAAPAAAARPPYAGLELLHQRRAPAGPRVGAGSRPACRRAGLPAVGAGTRWRIGRHRPARHGATVARVAVAPAAAARSPAGRSAGRRRAMRERVPGSGRPGAGARSGPGRPARLADARTGRHRPGARRPPARRSAPGGPPVAAELGDRHRTARWPDARPATSRCVGRSSTSGGDAAAGGRPTARPRSRAGGPAGPPRRARAPRSAPGRAARGGSAGRSPRPAAPATCRCRGRPRVSRAPRRCVAGGDRHPGVRRREGGGVLHQLGQHQDQVADHRGRHQYVVRDAARRPGCSPRSRRAPAGPRRPAAAARRASSAPAAPESTTRLLALRRSRLETWSSRYRCCSRSGSVSCALQPVDQRDLPADQVLGTPADVAEHLRHVAPAGDLPLDQPGRGAAAPGRRRGPGRRSRPGAPTSTGSRRTGSGASASSSATRTSSASATRATRSAERVSRVSGRATVRATARLSTTTSSSRTEQAGGATVRGGQRLPLLLGRHLGGDVGDDLLLDELAERDEEATDGKSVANRQAGDRRGRVGGDAGDEVAAGPGRERLLDQPVERELVGGGEGR